MDSWLLTAMTFLPAAAGAGLFLLRADRERAAKIASLAASLATLGLASAAWAAFDPSRGGEFQFAVSVPWIDRIGLRISYAMGVDGLALSMVALTALLTPLCVLCSWHSVRDRVRSFLAALLFLEAAMIGVFAARDLFLFYVFWEAMLVPMALLIGIWGGPRRVYAAVKFFLYTMVGSVLMLLAIAYVYGAAQCSSFEIGHVGGRLQEAALPLETQKWLFLAFAVAFAIKVPLFPFHTWLPDAHVEAPTAGSVILAGVLLKMGAYGFLRFAIPFFPAAAAHFAPLVTVLAVVSIIFGALMSMVQGDIKKLIAYSSVSHLGFVMLGIFSFTIEGMQGAVLQMVNHGISTGALFLLVGVIYEKTHKRGVDDFGGLARVMPVYATIFLVVTLSSVGLPGLNGFVGEFLVLVGAYLADPWTAAFAATGVVLGAVYMLRLYRDVFFGKVRTARYEKIGDAGRTDVAALLPLVAFIFLLGVLPGPLLRVTERSSREVLQSLRAGEDGHGRR